MNEVLLEKIKEIFAGINCGHDISHIKRVVKLAKKIHATEGGNWETIEFAAILHDIHRLMERETGNYLYPKESIPKVKEILSSVKTDFEKEILFAVENHELHFDGKFFGGPHLPIEVQILQDADALDQIGAIGIARCIAYSTANNIPINSDDIPYDVKVSSGRSPSALNHMYNILLGDSTRFNTKTAQQIADKRIKFVQSFINEFLEEWG